MGRAEGEAVADALSRGERIALRPGWRFPLVSLPAATILLAVWPVIVVVVVKGKGLNAAAVLFLAVWYGIVAALGVLSLHTWRLHLHSAIQFTAEELRYWDGRGRLHAIPWRSIDEVRGASGIRDTLCIRYRSDDMPQAVAIPSSSGAAASEAIPAAIAERSGLESLDADRPSLIRSLMPGLYPRVWRRKS